MSHPLVDPRRPAHRPRQSRLAFLPCRLVVPLFLCLLLAAQFVSQWSLLAKPAYAATGTPVQSTPPSLTFAQYLKDSTHPSPPRKGPPSPYPQPAKNEQNQLVWSGNSGTSSCSGNGSPGTPSGSIAVYSPTFVYTHLGQLWQGPLNGGSTQYQYLYCNSSSPHQLTGLYSLGATCSNQTGQSYASSYDQWGNVTGRTYSGATGTLTDDILDHLTQWYVSSSTQEQYLYDAKGNRVLRRSTNGNGTTLITYPFGLEEHQYSGSGANQSNTYYYFLGSRLIGDLDANNTSFLLTDALGSMLSEINWSAGGASEQGNQLFGPYGNGRYYVGNLNIAKGFIGQYNDGLTGLDYYDSPSIGANNPNSSRTGAKLLR